MQLKGELSRLCTLTNIEVTVSTFEDIVEYIREKGYTAQYGARRMRNVVHKEVQTAFLEAVFSKITLGSLVLKQGKLFIEKV